VRPKLQGPTFCRITCYQTSCDTSKRSCSLLVFSMAIPSYLHSISKATPVPGYSPFKSYSRPNRLHPHSREKFLRLTVAHKCCPRVFEAPRLDGSQPSVYCCEDASLEIVRDLKGNMERSVETA